MPFDNGERFSVHLNGRGQDVDGAKPCLDERGPVGDGERTGSKTVAVTAFSVEVKFGGDF
jgi:hypothetical protein